MQTSRGIVAALLVGALASVCGGKSDSHAAATTTVTTTVTPTVTLTPTQTPDENSTTGVEPNFGKRALRIGQPREGRSITTTVEQIRYPYPPAQYRDPAPGHQFVGLLVKQCLHKDAPRVDEYGDPTYSTYNGEFAAVSPNGTPQAGSGDSWNDWPTPKFPESVTMDPGDCLHGWLTLKVKTGMKITKIVRRPGGETVAEWLP
jgi:hypothetical protein